MKPTKKNLIMINSKKNCYCKIYKDPTGGKKDWVVEVGGEFDAFRIAVDFADLITIKNEIITIEERTKQNERDIRQRPNKKNPANKKP